MIPITADQLAEWRGRAEDEECALAGEILDAIVANELVEVDEFEADEFYQD